MPHPCRILGDRACPERSRRGGVFEFAARHRVFEPTSIKRLVMRTSPRICVHSETMLPTTCPHLLFGSMALNASPQATPGTRRNTVSECSRRNSAIAEANLPFGRLLSVDPFSYRCLVMTTVTKTPVQSAMAFPKNDPKWVAGLEWL